MICARCGLASCACRTGKTRITVGAVASVQEARSVAEGYLDRRGWQGELIDLRRKRQTTGLLGYQAWTLTYRVTRPGQREDVR